MKTILLIVLCFCSFPCDVSVLNDSIQPQGHVNLDVCFSTIPYRVLIDRMGTIMMVNVKAYQL
nr:hypothetical protein [uncultured Bacteroides sp.]